jgi:hypothetical protein
MVCVAPVLKGVTSLTDKYHLNVGEGDVLVAVDDKEPLPHLDTLVVEGTVGMLLTVRVTELLVTLDPQLPVTSTRYVPPSVETAPVTLNELVVAPTFANPDPVSFCH